MSVAVPLSAVFILSLIAIIDWRRHQIWHAITLPSSIAAVLFAHWLPAKFIPNALLGASLCFALFLLIRQTAKHVYGTDALGFGDVMLALLIGAIGGVVNGLLWLAVGMLFAGAFAAYQLISKHNRRQRFAYGSWLALAGIIGLIVDQLTH